ncbi:MFS transporter [Streptomyces sp. NPDC059785]|uniref:MFS transporter n=1 Tax=Streptomyces sp. NPDC059785 TaxID=3346945 RepID=UPI003648DF02
MPPDGTVTGQGAPGLFSRAHRARTLAVSATFLLVAFAALALGTAMPVAVQDLDALALYAIAFGGYLSASLVGTVLGGNWADRRGPAAPLFAGSLCFVVGSLLAGAAPTVWPFLAGRFAQGLGGGAMTVALYVVVGQGYPAGLRPRMFSLITACWILPSMIGPAIAGTVTERLSWRWVFYGIALLTLGATALLRRPLAGLGAGDAAAGPSRDGSGDGPSRVGAGDAPDEAPRSGTGDAPDGLSRVGADGGADEPSQVGADGEADKASRVGTVPAVGVAVGAALLQYAGSRPSPHTAVLAALGLAAVAAGVRGLLPPGTLRARRGLPSLVLLRGVAGGAYFALESYVPLLLVKGRTWTPTAAGYSLTGASLAWAAAAWLQGRPTLRMPRERVIALGALLHAAGAALALAGVLRTAPAVTAPAGFAIAAFGMGLLLPGIGVLTLEQSPPGRQGANTAALQMADSLCSVLLIGLCGALFNVLHRAAGPDTAAFAAAFAAALAATLLACPTASRLTTPVREHELA